LWIADCGFDLRVVCCLSVELLRFYCILIYEDGVWLGVTIRYLLVFVCGWF